jgi:hypothetical protein
MKNNLFIYRFKQLAGPRFIYLVLFNTNITD